MDLNMKPLKKSFSAPNKIPNTTANKLLKMSKKEENSISCCAESSKSSEKEAKRKTVGKQSFKLSHPEKNAFKQETRKSKSLTDEEYEEIFRNVINALEIDNLEHSIHVSKKKNLAHNKHLIDAEKINKTSIEDAVGTGENIKNVIEKYGVADEISKKHSSFTDQKAFDTDSVDSEDIDEWDNLSNSVKGKKKLKSYKTLNCKKQLAITKSLSEEENTEVPEQLLNKGSCLPKSNQQSQKKKTNLKLSKLNHDCSIESENCSSNEIEEKGTWVQCSNNICNKWRYLEDIEDPQLVPENWECRMNSDVEHNSCELPEVHYDETEHIFTKYTLGSVVWAKMDGYPWWPALIDNDPDYEIYFQIPSEDSMIPTHFHVTFFGNCASRAWIKHTSIVPYIKDNPISKLSVGHKKDITVAMNQANLSLEMNLRDRLEKYGFTQNLTKKSSILKKSLFKSRKQILNLNHKSDKNPKAKHMASVSTDISNDDQNKICTKIDEKNTRNASLKDVKEKTNADENDANRSINENEFVGSSIIKSSKSLSEVSEKSTCLLTKKPEIITKPLPLSEKETRPTLDTLNSELMNKKELNKNVAFNSGTEYYKQNSKHKREKSVNKKDTTVNTKIKQCKLKTATCQKRKLSSKRDETENTASNRKIFKSKKEYLQVEKNATLRDENENKQEENLEKIYNEKQDDENSHDNSTTSQAVKLITDKTSALHENEIGHNKLLSSDKNHVNKEDKVKKKKQKSENFDSIGLDTVDEVTSNKANKKKKAFLVPVTKNIQNISLCTHSTEALKNCEDNSRLVPDINVPVNFEDITNEDEPQNVIDLPFITIDKNDTGTIKNNEKLDLKCSLNEEDSKRVVSDDDGDSSDFVMDIEVEDENKILVDTLKEVEERFGSHCFEHSLDSDPLDLIEE